MLPIVPEEILEAFKLLTEAPEPQKAPHTVVKLIVEPQIVGAQITVEPQIVGAQIVSLDLITPLTDNLVSGEGTPIPTLLEDP